ncbi:MAG: SMP-30/gluconolactonase/LRE family protein [Propionicimonas sp.]
MKIVATLDELLEPDSQVELLATGYEFTEGPVWVPDGSLLFSDIPRSEIHRWTEARGAELVAGGNRKGNGMTTDRSGQLLVCEHASSSLRLGVFPEERAILADHWGGAELNSPNDVVVTSDGWTYFTDPRFGRTLPTVGVVRQVPQSASRVYRLFPATGEMEALDAEFEEPNGLCFSPDERYLYVGDTPRANIRRLELAEGRVIADEVFIEHVSDSPRDDDNYIDGMKVDELGNLYFAGPRGIWVASPSGHLLGEIVVPEQVANLNWGDADYRSLYITAVHSLYRVRMRVAGVKPGWLS